MKIFIMTGFAFLYYLTICPFTMAQTTPDFTNIPLNDLSAFNEPGKNWVISSDVAVDYTLQGDMTPINGNGIIVNDMSEKNKTHLFTKELFGDLELQLDFMMANSSNSGVYLQGRYEIQLFDSWRKQPVTSSDCGGIYQRWKPERGRFEGTTPFMNVCRAPGLWQHLVIKFRAPKFNAKGEKIANAVFEQVYLNGVLVQEQAQVTGPTNSAMFPNEKNEQSLGPLVLQGDHGKVAFKNIRYRKLPTSDSIKNSEIDYWQTRNSIFVTPGIKPVFIKTFLNYGDKKLTHVLSVGNGNQVNYSYDVKTGAIFQIWRGNFMDLTKSWEDRGGEQLGTPLGSVIELSNSPVVATLSDSEEAWPDSMSFEDLDNKGYILNKVRSPVFDYSIKGIEVKDSIVTRLDGKGINRTIDVLNPSHNVYCLIAEGNGIMRINSDTYSINDKSYYIKIDKKYNPIVRRSQKGQELIVKCDAAGSINYSLIW